MITTMKSLLVLILTCAACFGQADYTTLLVAQAPVVAGGGDFDPDTLSGAVMVLKNSAISGANGDDWATWTDATGTQNMTNLTGGTTRPIVTNSVANGKSAIRFDASNDFMKSSLSLSAPYTIAFVAMTPATSGDRRLVCSGNGSDNRIISLCRNSGTYCVYLGADAASGFSPAQNVAHVAFLTVTSGGNNYWLDGTNRTSTASTTAAFNQVSLGSTGIFAESANQFLFEMRCYNRVLTTNEMNSLAGWWTNNVAGIWSNVP